MNSPDKPPRWNADPPPGFAPDGSSMIAPPGQEPKYPETKVEVGGQLYSPSELDELLADADKGIEDDDDLSDLDELADL